MRVLLACLLAITFLLAPAAGKVGINNPTDPTPTTLYFHLLDGQQDFPINTQPPSDDFAISPNVGLTTSTTSCLGTQQGLVGKEWHTWYGYSSPSLVQYDFLENGRPRVHSERGLSYNVVLDTNAQPVLYWYMETMAGANAADAAPMVVPNVVVAATIRTGSAVGIGDEHYNTGALLAEGSTEPSLLAAEATQGPARYIPGARPVYEFPVPLAFQGSDIPSDTGYNVRIDVYMDNPACGEGNMIMPNVVRLHTSPEQRPRMELTTRNPVEIQALHPQFVGDDLVVHVMANSPWGSYDVDEQAGLDFAIQGPSEPRDVEVRLTTHIHDHGPTAHFNPLGIAYIWPYKAEQARPGAYTVQFGAWNDQHTAQATGTATFEVGKTEKDTCAEGIDAGDNRAVRTCVTPEPKGKGAPGPGLLAVAGLLGAALLLRRR